MASGRGWRVSIDGESQSSSPKLCHDKAVLLGEASRGHELEVERGGAK